MHPFVWFDWIGPVPGVDRAERRAVTEEAIRRIRRSGGLSSLSPAGELYPPAARRASTRALMAIPLGLVIVLVVFDDAILAVIPGTPWRLFVLMGIALGLGFAAEWITIRRTKLPWAWAILRERGVDICLQCGAIGTPDPAAARSPTRCPECGFDNPAVPSAADRPGAVP